MIKNTIYKIMMILMVSPIAIINAAPIEKGIEVNLNIPPTVVEATLPLKMACSIDPNRNYDEAFVAPSYTIENNTNAPIRVSMKVVPDNTVGTPPKITDPNKHTDWRSLNSNISEKDIAIKLNEEWFSEDLDYITIDPKIKSKTKKVYDMGSKHGMAFKTGMEFKYKIITLIELI